MNLNKLKKSFLIITLCIFWVGCKNNSITMMETNEQNNPNGQETDNNTEVLGSLSHGLANYSIDSDTGFAFLTYHGGELHLSYQVSALGMATKGLGFMVFVDGAAQQYRVGDDMDYRYMHTFYLEDNMEYILSFYFVPTTGQAGDELELCIASIYYPDYTPDMVESKGYGIYHDMLESIYILKYKNTPLEMESPILPHDLLSFVTVQENDLDTGMNTDTMMEAARLFINNQDVTLGNFYSKKDNDSIHIRLEFSSHPFAEYGCTFYLDHQPISNNIENIITLQDKKTIMEATMDLSDIETPATFYAVLAPRNSTRISDANIGLVKTNSVLLINENNTEADSMEKPSVVKELFIDSSLSANCYVRDDEIMLLGNHITLIDCINLKIKKKSEDMEIGFTFHDFLNYEVVVREGGYNIIGIRHNSEESRNYLTLVLLDHDLNLEKVIDIGEEVGLTYDIRSYKLFDSGNKLLFSTVEGFYLYDFIKKEVKRLIDDNIDIDINYCGFLAGSEQIVFTGIEFHSERLPSQVLGRMELDGSGLKKVGEVHLWGELWSFEDFALIEEAEIVDKECERLVFHYDKDGEIRAYPFSIGDESYQIYPSDKGGYYVTMARIKEEGYRIRLYSGENGHLARELSMTFDAYGNEFRIFQVSVCEAAGKIIISTGDLDYHKGFSLMSIDLND